MSDKTGGIALTVHPSFNNVDLKLPCAFEQMLRTLLPPLPLPG
jgi:hypothetical protein